MVKSATEGLKDQISNALKNRKSIKSFIKLHNGNPDIFKAFAKLLLGQGGKYKHRIPMGDILEYEHFLAKNSFSNIDKNNPIHAKYFLKLVEYAEEERRLKAEVKENPNLKSIKENQKHHEKNVAELAKQINENKKQLAEGNGGILTKEKKERLIKETNELQKTQAAENTKLLSFKKQENAILSKLDKFRSKLWGLMPAFAVPKYIHRHFPMTNSGGLNDLIRWLKTQGADKVKISLDLYQKDFVKKMSDLSGFVNIF